jgi:hypothetical protein
VVLVVVELAIIRWTRHHVHIAHHVSSSEEDKAPPGHYKTHTSRSILDILRGLASLRNQDAQPMDVIDRRVAIMWCAIHITANMVDASCTARQLIKPTK